MTTSTEQINVLLIDDSSVIRSALKKIIESESDLNVVGFASDGQAGISAAKLYQPNIIILDIEMPVMDGLTALPELLKVSPNAKVIMFSSLTAKGGTATLKAFSLGALECIVKPSSQEGIGPGSEFQKRFVQTIRDLGQTNVLPGGAAAQGADSKAKSLLSSDFKLFDDSMSYKGKPKILMIGSSTGGPNALFEVIKNFKGFDIPIVLTQHMPATFTRILAEHIEQKTGVSACEGEEGMVLEPGRVHVAPGDYHMEFKSGEGMGKTVITLNQNPPVNFCRPAVDPMFQSAISLYNNRILGVILTGMGNDGEVGGGELVKAGGRLIAQDEATSTVWGMPGAVAKAGICSAVLPLNEIGPWVGRAVKG